ncbi:AmmeMemoRadiSam system radical SAM enzyme [Dethiobacter alkaliphilus]|uniref:AmmeMemoRadiSam system radical SAM enzyme n=1 Tax=Dethiobacter alkaliphilus TaxID=427926 RepID=UPI002226F699|nr:AmmeMemoRadiSam system radical SAM enzyme [Dethiobacter alkaliphilus]MCW3490624.1 AmmeMemoRadiSam system radical SAM enzyme [Dethiobacter alkaliphilus]
MHEALFYKKKRPVVHCELCPQFCRLKNGELGVCGVRQEEEGKLYSLNYGICAGMALDPIEKKPLYHYQPGRQVFSVGTLGCNLGCGFCQNWHLARKAPGVQTVRLTPEQLVARLDEAAAQKPVGMAYTYSEPGMWFEYVLDTAKLVREKGFKNIMVTNGFLNEEPLIHLLPLIDAFNIDVKAFRDEYYREHCKGRLEPVLRYVEIAAQSAHVELTYLVVPTLNDQEEDIRRFTDWVAGINPAIPVHFSRYYPQHEFKLPPTPVEVMEHIRSVALEKLNYVYLGNLPGSKAANTFCPQCGKEVISRDGYRVENLLQAGNCAQCGWNIEVNEE